MSNIIDSYSESNQSGLATPIGSSDFGYGQIFTGNGATLGGAAFYLRKSGSPTGNATANIYAITGTVGSTATPTGSSLASSDAFDVSTLTSTFKLITFTFSGANQITLTNATNYAVVFEYALGNASNNLTLGTDSSSPTHTGNATFSTSPTLATWGAVSSIDACFYVFDNTFPFALGAKTTGFTTSVTSMAVGLPSVNSGDLLIAVSEVRNPGTWTTIPSGFNQIFSPVAAGGVGDLTAFYRICDGTEGSTATWVTSVGNTASWQVRRITNWHGTTPPEAATTNSGGSPSTNDPPSLTPSWGSDNTLWYAVMGTTANGTTISAAPTNYSDFATLSVSSGGSQAGTGTAYRQLNATSEDPGSFTTTSDRWWMAAIIAIRPAAAGAGGQTISATGISSTSVLGAPSLTPGSVSITASGMVSTLALGAAALTATYVVATTGIGSTTSLGTPSLTPGAVSIVPGGISSTATIGTPTITPGGVSIVPTGLSPTSVLGAIALTSTFTLAVTGVASTSAIGTPTLSPGAVSIQLTGLSSTVSVGAPTVSSSAGSQTLSPSGIASTASVGSPGLSSTYTVSPSGVASTATVGSATLSPGQVSVAPTNIAKTSVVGSPALSPGSVAVTPAGLGSHATIGSPALAPGSVSISATSIDSTLSVGQPAAAVGGSPQNIAAGSISSSSTVGVASVHPGVAIIIPASVASATHIGIPVFALLVTLEVSGIDSTLVFGLPTLSADVQHGKRSRNATVLRTHRNATAMPGSSDGTVLTNNADATILRIIKR